MKFPRRRRRRNDRADRDTGRGAADGDDVAVSITDTLSEMKLVT